VTDQTWPPRGDRVLNSWKCARRGPTVEAVTPLQHTAAPFPFAGKRGCCGGFAVVEARFYSLSEGCRTPSLARPRLMM
jgi:hypothetical protein